MRFNQQRTVPSIFSFFCCEMPFATPVEFRTKVEAINDIEDWTNRDEELRIIAAEAASLTQVPLEMRPALQQFQCRYHEYYAKEHHLQRFLSDVVHFAVQTQSETPLIDLIAALEKRLIV